MNKPPEFQTVIPKLGANRKAATSSPKLQPQGNFFPKIRDFREARGARQITPDAQTLFRICALL